MMIEKIANGVSNAVSAASAVGGTVKGLVGGGGGAASFGGMLESMVSQTSALDAKASQAVSGLLNGQGVEILDAMIATQKADMAFELALQVRNKAVGAYQQMMGMQF
jgi:flagellar hook-basal body complex protein FliE